jgi:RNA polymerase sigma-70 factor, ECF subfamily
MVSEDSLSMGRNEPRRSRRIVEAIATVRPTRRFSTSELEAADEFVSFFETEFNRVLRAAYLFCGDYEAASDAAQEAFARAYERWARLRAKPWLSGWLMTTAFNLCKRQAMRTRRESALNAGSLEAGTSPSSRAERVDVVRAIRALPIRQRQTVTLFYLTDYSSAQVAHVLGISEGAVKKHLARARESLRNAPELGELPNE